MIHETQITIRTFHTDAFGHVNNSRYLEVFEEARWRYAEDISLIQLLRDRNLGFIIMDLRLRFRKPVSEGDEIKIKTWLDTLGTASGEVKQSAHRGDESAAVTGLFHFILIDRDTGKSVPIDGNIRELLLGFVEKGK
jgi:thioesterase-3